MTLAENLEVAQPARHRRRVRLPGAAHRHRQAAGLPREPAEGQLQGPPRPGAERRRRGAPLQPELRGRPRDREVAAATRDFRRALVARHRPRPAQRDVLARPRHAGLGRARPRHDRTARGRSGARSGRRSTSKQANELLDKIGLTRRTPRGTACAPTARARLRIELMTVGGAVRPVHADRRDGPRAVEEDRHRGRRQGARAQPRHHARRRATSTRSSSGPTTAPSICSPFPRHVLPVDAGESLHRAPLYAHVVSQSGGTQGKEPDDPQMLKS